MFATNTRCCGLAVGPLCAVLLSLLSATTAVGQFGPAPFHRIRQAEALRGLDDFDFDPWEERFRQMEEEERLREQQWKEEERLRKIDEENRRWLEKMEEQTRLQAERAEQQLRKMEEQARGWEKRLAPWQMTNLQTDLNSRFLSPRGLLSFGSESHSIWRLDQNDGRSLTEGLRTIDETTQLHWRPKWGDFLRFEVDNRVFRSEVMRTFPNDLTSGMTTPDPLGPLSDLRAQEEASRAEMRRLDEEARLRKQQEETERWLRKIDEQNRNLGSPFDR